jgi:hypothetical protein
MCKSEIDVIRGELQMVTGEVSLDVDYLVARLLQNGSKFQEIKKNDSKFVEVGKLFEPSAVSLDEWFDSLEDGDCDCVKKS